VTIRTRNKFSKRLSSREGERFGAPYWLCVQGRRVSQTVNKEETSENSSKMDIVTNYSELLGFLRNTWRYNSHTVPTTFCAGTYYLMIGRYRFKIYND
jgi:hypothetical protein